MLSSTKRYILHVISVTLAIVCLTAGLVLKHGDFAEPPVFSDALVDPSLEVSTVSMDSIGWYPDSPPISNPDD